VATPSHGGIRLSSERNADVHPVWRREDGWYEEDCEWAIVAMSFPDDFPGMNAHTAHRTARDWYPDEYETVTGRAIEPGQSYKRDEQTFFAEHANDWLGVSAIGLGDGTVEVTARLGGHGGAPGSPYRTFIVPKANYDARNRFGFVVEPGKYEEVTSR